MSTLDNSAANEKGHLRPRAVRWTELTSRQRTLPAISALLLKWRRKRRLRGLSAVQLADAGIPKEYADRRGAADENAATWPISKHFDERAALLADSRMLMLAFGTIVLAQTSWAAEIKGSIEGMLVDAAIVLAVDVSSSVDVDQAMIQRQGHADALRSREVNAAIAGGLVGCIATTYVEWSSVGTLRTVLPWTRLCDDTDTDAAAGEIVRRGDDGSERRGRGRTSLSFAIDASSMLLDRFPGETARKIIDISSNGTNNDGVPVTESRDRAIQKGYVVNGIVLARDEPGLMSDLPEYFRRNVIGGSHSFVIVPESQADYATALRRKLVFEISYLDHFWQAGGGLHATGEGASYPGLVQLQAERQGTVP